MSRRDIDNSSYDLFLDTICNTFGGIVFLAILLAILIQTRAIVKTPDQKDESPPSVAEVRVLIEQLDEANAEYAAVVASLERLPSPVATSDDEQYRKLTQEHDTAEKKLADAMEEQVRETQRLAIQLAKNAEIAHQNAGIPIELKEVESKVDAESASLKRLVSNRQTTLRLPRDKASNAASVLALLQGSRVYLAKTPSASVREFEDEYVSTQSTLAGGITIKPRSGRGWTINDPRLDSMIKNARSRGFVVTIAVWPESYADFSIFKKALIEDQVPYQLWPQQHGEELTVFIGGGQSRVQ